MDVQSIARKLRDEETRSLGAGEKHRTAGGGLDDHGSRESSVVKVALEMELATAPDILAGQLNCSTTTVQFEMKSEVWTVAPGDLEVLALAEFCVFAEGLLDVVFNHFTMDVVV
jgi:hypothetical protein